MADENFPTITYKLLYIYVCMYILGINLEIKSFSCIIHGNETRTRCRSRVLEFSVALKLYFGS